MDTSFQSLDVQTAQRDLAHVYEQVVRGIGRVELTRDGSDEVCVLMSKSELEGLERALEILSDTEEVRALRAALARVVSLCAENDRDDEAFKITETKLMAVAQQ